MAVDPKSLQKYLPLVLVGGAVVLLIIGLTGGGASHSKKAGDAHNEKAQNYVNQHLRRTAERIELQQRQMSMRNWQLANDYKTTVPEKAYTPPKEGSELREQANAKDVAKDLGRDDAPQALPNDPMNLVQQQLFQAQATKTYDEAYRKEYARQFIENARRGGYEIQLSDDYRVISVKPIRSPSSRYSAPIGSGDDD